MNQSAKGDVRRKNGTRVLRPYNTYSFREASFVLGFGFDYRGAKELIEKHIPYQTVVWRGDGTKDYSDSKRIFIKKTDLLAYVAAHEEEIAIRSLKRGTLK